MGDVAMTVPVVYALAKEHPTLRITVVSRPFAKAFFEGLAENIDFLGIDPKKDFKGLSGLNRLYALLKEKTDGKAYIADFHNVLRTKYLRFRFALAGHRTAVINKHKSGKRQLCRKTNKVLRQQPTSFQNYADVLAQLGWDVQPKFTTIFEHKENSLANLPYIIGEKKENEPWIGIAPFAAHKGKMYPQEKMEEVVRQLSTHPAHPRIFLFGAGKAEVDIIAQWAEKYERTICVASWLKGMQQELILMSHLDTMVSMDSANMHLASLVGTRVVSVWGATHPFCGFLGWNQKTEDVVQNETLTCRPCSVFGNKLCHRGDFACMESITPETIINRLKLT